MTHVIICDVCDNFLGPFELFDSGLYEKIICPKCKFDNGYQIRENMRSVLNLEIDHSLADMYIDDDQMIDVICQSTGASRSEVIERLIEINMLENILNEPDTEFYDDEL